MPSYLSADQLAQVSGWTRTAVDRAVGSYMPKRLRVRFEGKPMEYLPVAAAYLRLVSILRDNVYGDSSRVPAQFAEIALPALERLMQTGADPDTLLTIRGSGCRIELGAAFVNEVRADIARLL